MKGLTGFSPPPPAFGLTPVLMLALALSVAASGQTPAPVQSEELKKLDFLVGEWKGTGLEFGPDGSRQEFTQKTKVEPKKGGSELRVRDERKYRSAVRLGVRMARSSALDATVYYDAERGLYRWRGENQYGRRNPLEAKLIDARALQYGMPFSVTTEPEDGNRRTTIRVDEGGEWRETLEVWDRGGWHKLEESTLRRVK
jgi:hypothetical protein